MRDLISTLTRASNKAPVPYVPASYANGLSHIYSEPKGAEAEMRAYGANGTLFGLVNRLMTTTGSVGWKLWQKAASGKKEDRKEVTRHLALNVWNKPNKFFTQRRLIESGQQHNDLTGETWLIVARNPLARSIPLELWPVRPDRIRPAVHPQEFITGYIYTGPNGEQVPLEIDDVIPMFQPDPENHYRGLGPVQALLRTIDSQKFSEEWNRNFFRNSAKPGGVIEVEERLSDEEFNEFRDRWAESHQGLSNAHRVAILENGMKWVDAKISQREMQFAELAEIAPNRIREAFGFPQFAQGIVEDVNRASAEASDAMYAKWLAVPRLDRWKDALNSVFLPMFGDTAANLEFDYDDPIPPDAAAQNAERESKATAAKTYIDAGFDGDSVKTALDLPDTLKWEKPEPPAPPVMPGQPGQADAKPPAKKPAALRLWNAAPDDTEPDADMEQVQADWEEQLAALLVVWAGITAAQQAELLPQVIAIVAAGDIAALAALTVTVVTATAVLTAAMAAMGARAARRMAAEAAAQGVQVPVPVSLPGLDPIAEAVAQLLGEGLAQAAGKEAVRVYAPGVAAEQVALQVGAHLEGLSDAYLREQLGAALTRAQNVGRLETVRDVPQTIYWASETLDRNTCKPCREIDGTEFESWKAAWDAYGGGTYRACLGRNRCRGTVRATWNPRAGA